MDIIDKNLTDIPIKTLRKSIRMARVGLEPAPIPPGEILFSSRDGSWKMTGSRFPYSCTDEEGEILYRVIVGNSLTSGFEIATAFGYSTSYIAMGMKETNGQITTMDCYVEELNENFHYTQADLEHAVQLVREQIITNVSPKGLSVAQANAKQLDVVDRIRFVVGISPHDVPQSIQSTLDFVLIDGGHFGDQPTKDYLAIRDVLRDRSVVFFHDNNGNRSVEAAIQIAANRPNSEVTRFETRYGLTMVSRGLTSKTTEAIESSLVRRSPLRVFVRGLRAKVARKWRADVFNFKH